MTTYRMDPEPDADILWGDLDGGAAWVTLTRRAGSRRDRWRTPDGFGYTWPEVLRDFKRVTDVNPDPFADYPLPWTYNKDDCRVVAANGQAVADMAARTYLATLIVAAVNAHAAQLPAREATA